ncbi:acyl-CoA desaturase [Exaiptasia diaphana]|uniref:Fatty acid desaturase domain-containing protein n=1 Tax=Exaiptasia diaphana TaxID=2652724 RepID=A0A913X8X7_EXADI|nr:acyl-CoA desaturase [Exaiptasia diaphana]
MENCVARDTITKTKDEIKDETQSTTKSTKVKIVWTNVIFMIILHVMGVYGMLLLPKLKFLTMTWVLFCYIYGGIGVTMGAHRLWAHRSYKAMWPLRLILMLANSMAAQNDIFEWARDHRVHHKYAETDADPHNANRGFFFAHMGWLLQKKHPDVITKGKGLDLSDLYADKIVMFQRRYFKTISFTMCVVVPTAVPYLWGESLWLAYFTAFASRYVWLLHATWSVNSFAHMFGDKPYDVNINPAENNLVTFFSCGEGFHNYHHTFPQDYSTSEFGTKSNVTTRIINFFAWIGWAYDRKTIPKDVIIKRMQRTGKLRSVEPGHEQLQ